MKKINLKHLANPLTDEQMKKVQGGETKNGGCGLNMKCQKKSDCPAACPECGYIDMYVGGICVVLLESNM